MTGLLQHWVTDQAERRPQATALAFGREKISYGELEENSNRLARLLKSMGCGKGDRVCFLMPKSPTAIVCMLGILKADCIYVPLDINSPALRLAKMIETCEPCCILAADSSVGLLNELESAAVIGTSVRVGWMGTERAPEARLKFEFSLSDLASYSAVPRDYQNDSEKPAYILFTSGSTGRPKGVVITHSNVIHFVSWAKEYFQTTPADRLSGHSPLHFDLSAYDVFGTFASGAQLHMVPPEVNLLPNKLADFIRDSELTQWFSVPSALSYMAQFDVVAYGDFVTLRHLLWCGEVLPTPTLIYWMQRLPHVTFTNLYGPTETTIASSYHTVPECPEAPCAVIPIGTACRGEELIVLDACLEPASTGEVGDLYIRGGGLGKGYWRDPERTRAAFLSDPHSSDSNDRIYKTGDLASVGDDGLVYFHGRADYQIKSRGYRIELGEIESALNASGLVQSCVVTTVKTEGFESAVICCAYVPAPDRDVTSVSLRKSLSEVIPSYMLPARWMPLKVLPLNASGKVDRRQLRERFLGNETQADC